MGERRFAKCPVCGEPLLLLQREPPSTASGTGAWTPYCLRCRMEVVRA